MIGSALESLQDFYRTGFSIAVIIHSFDCTVHIAIAVIIHSFDRTGFLSHSLLSRLIVIHSFDRTLHIAIAVIIHSFDRSLQEINPKGWCAGDFYRTRYPLV